MRQFIRIATIGMAVFLGLAALTSDAWAVTYDEAVHGDLSGDRLNPTSLTLGLGANAVTSSSISGDRDYLHLAVPAGLSLDAILMQSYSGGDGLAFIGVQAGATFTEPPTGTNAANLLGWAHFGPNAGHEIGDNILDDLGAASPAIGFTGSLTESDYTFWIQQTNTLEASTYQLDFVVTPEPGELAALALAGLALARVRRHALPLT